MNFKAYSCLCEYHKQHDKWRFCYCELTETDKGIVLNCNKINCMMYSNEKNYN